MAIQRAFTDPETGMVSPAAHHVVGNPVMRHATQQVSLQVAIYASKADYDAGKEPAHVYERTFGAAQYQTVRNAWLNLAEPALISSFFPGGVRVAD